jgi:membrane-associated phospholipid phosphatase
MLAVVGLSFMARSGAATAASPGPAASQPAPATHAAAAPALPARPLGERLRVNWYVELPVAATLGVTYLTMEGFRSSLGPKHCRWCEPSLNGFDAVGRDTRWGTSGAADTLSSVFAFGLTPIVTEGLVTWDAYREGGWRRAAEDNLVIVEAAITSVMLVLGVKYATARQRPYVRELPAGTATGGDDNLSFPGGHTALAFSLATASGMVATLRGYRHAPYVWAAGLALAAFTGYLRMAADKHYLTDVLTGAAIGSAVGWSVPYLHHRWRW